MIRTLVVCLSLSTVAKAAEPLWSESVRGHHDATMNMQSFIKLARTLGPAVVNVIAIQPLEEAPGGQRRGRGQGTGFVINKAGYILTNTHVIENADDIRVRLSDERELTARLVG